jgi:sulfatase maturation enzyme AslB (radical SAM superfamily)
LVQGDKVSEIFLSYSETERTFADELKRVLEAPNLTVFMASKSIIAGAAWQSAIDQAIHDAGVFVALISKAWLASSHCQDEYRKAEASHKEIIPVYLERCPLQGHHIAARQFFSVDMPIKEFPPSEWGPQLWAAANAIREARWLDDSRELLHTAELLEYAGVGKRRPPLIVYHCDKPEHSSGRVLEEMLKDFVPAADQMRAGLHEVTKHPEAPKPVSGQTVFVIDSPTKNPFAQGVLLNYQRYMVGRKIHHVTTLDRGIPLQAICADGRSLSSDRHEVALDDPSLSDLHKDYLVLMRLPGIVLDGNFSEAEDQRIVWLVYGTTFRGSDAGAKLFSKDNFDSLFTLLRNRYGRPPKAFQVVFEVPRSSSSSIEFASLNCQGSPAVDYQVLSSLRDRVRGDPVPPGIGHLLENARLNPDYYSKVPITAVHLDLVASCNYDCEVCIEKPLRGRNCYLSKEKAKAIISDLARLARPMESRGVEPGSTHRLDLSLYGGEPTLHPEFVEILKHAVDNHLRPFVVTNGSRLTVLADELVKLGSSVSLRVSLDADDEQKYLEHHRPKEPRTTFEDICAAVDRLSRYVDVGVSYLITSKNVSGLAPALERWRNQGSITSFNPRLPLGPAGCWTLSKADSDIIRKVLKDVPWQSYPPDWLVAPDWFHSWVRDGADPDLVWTFSRCYSAYYRLTISPVSRPASPATCGFPGEKTEDATISSCPYHRYHPRYSCSYPTNLEDWCNELERRDIAAIRPIECRKTHRTVCSRVAHNAAVQAEINRIRAT